MDRIGRPYTARLRWVFLFSVVLLIMAGGFGQKITPRAQASTGAGYRDFSYAASGVSAPTGQKPQSKLWFNDGSWWGILFDSTSEEYHIYRYNRANLTWSDTGTVVDERNDARPDALWDGSSGKLYVASAGPGSTDPADSGRFLRYSYDPVKRSYSLDSGFPVVVSSGGMEAIVVEKDTTGRFWITYTQDGKVFVNHSLGDDQSWGTPFVLPVSGASNLTFDDISAIISFDSRIGVMWSNHNDGAMYFATHADGDPDNAWQVQAAIKGTQYADDHINLKSLQADPSGEVFAAVKTSLNDGANPDPNAPLILLLVRDQSGSWSSHTFGTVADNHTRPIVLIDREHRNLYMFATAPVTGGTIYYKETPLSDISFPSGKGTPFVQSSTDPQINNATSTKQDLDSTTGLMVMASDDSTGFYLHNTIDLGAPPPPACTITGTSGNDTLTGTSGPDVICGLGGNDTIKGLGGDDILRGGDGADRLFGGPGNDTLDGGAGTDSAAYSTSGAPITASLAAGTATGDGTDSLTGIENLIGSKFGDTLTGSDGPNALSGGGGVDTLRGGLGNDKVVGGSGADVMYGEDGNDALNSKDGVNGNDSLDGGPGTDTCTTDATEASIVNCP